MILIFSLELNSLRLVKYLLVDGRLVIQREEKYFFSKEALHSKIFIQEIKSVLEKIKATWKLPAVSLHCILSADFTLLRVATSKKAFRFISSSKFIQRDAKEFLPLPLEQVCIAYQKMSSADDSISIVYAAIKRNFLEAIVISLQEIGFKIQKISILPLSLCSSKQIFHSPSEETVKTEKTLLINLTERSAIALIFSPLKNLVEAHVHPLGNFNHHFCEKETGIPFFLFFRLKKAFGFFKNSTNFGNQCLVLKNNSSEKQSTSFSLFLKKEFLITSLDIDPLLLLPSTFSKSFVSKFFHKIPAQLSQAHHILLTSENFLWNSFFKPPRYHISSVEKFTIPSIKRYRNKQQTLFCIYAFIFSILLISPITLFYDYLENKKSNQASYKASLYLQQQEKELRRLRQQVKQLSDEKKAEQKLKELQADRDKWPLLITELQQCAPSRGIWITQLAPVVREIKKGASEISALEIKGLYLEKINGEELVHEYIKKLNSSSLFIPQKQESSLFSCTKENGTAYAYPFTAQLLLSSPIQL